MKITYNWLKDFVKIKLKPQELADKLTMAGIEVKAVEEKNGDFVFEIEITSNRPDWLSAVGLAREVAAITKQKIKVTRSPGHQVTKSKNKEIIKIEIEDQKDCPLYTAKVIQNIKVASSASWLRDRLESIGCRSINNIVDITNYAMFTYGEPLHAFDLDKVQGGKIVVRRAKAGEKLITIDGVERNLDPAILVIADNLKPIAIAGVMGGKDTEVTEKTKNILLEAAVFNQVIVRRSRQKLALQTDSSYRFERGIDLDTARNTSLETAALIKENAGGDLILSKDSSLLRPKKKIVELNILSLSKILGVNISASQAKSILTALGFKLKIKGKFGFQVQVPSFRQDVSLEMDLVEEVARIYGYEKIPVSLPKFIPQISPSEAQKIIPLTRQILVALGLHEAITYTLVDKNSLKGFYSDENKLLEILNPLSKDQEILRPTIMPSLLKAVAYNLNQKQEEVELFEIGNVYTILNHQNPTEVPVLCVALCGTKSMFLEQGAVKEKIGIFHLKGIIETWLKNLGIANYSFSSLDNSLQLTINLGQDKVGEGFIVNSGILDKFDIKNKTVVMAEVYLNKVSQEMHTKKKFLGLPLYPGITRDISILIKEDVCIQDIIFLVREKSLNLLEEVKIVDYYKGKQIPVGFRSITISCLYRSDKRTLTEEEVSPVYSCVCSALKEKFSAQIRGI